MLARQKLGLEEDSFIETKYIWWGKFMEEHILRAFDELTGIDVEPTHEMVIKGLIGTTLDAYAYPPPDLKPDTSRYVDWVGDVPTEPYLLEVELEVETADGAVTHVVEVEAVETSFALPAGAAVTDVRLDPRHRILRWTPEYGERL